MTSTMTRFRQPLTVALMAAFLLLPAAAETAEMTDIAVADRVEDELMMDPAVPAFQIDVVNIDGIVTLSGTVGNALAKQRAATVAETVKGVRGVVSTIQVTPSPERSDDAIERDVRQALLADRATASYAVEVAVKDNVVRLTGEVDSWQAKQLCAKVARGVRGVTGVTNQIEVDAGAPRSDEEIQADIEDALYWDAMVDDALVDVQVDDGRVVLSGTVGSAAEKRRAVADAYTAGVERVSAEALEVRLWARTPELRGDKYDDKSDADLRRAVEDALAIDPRVAAGSVTTEVEDRVVTLRGTVNHLKGKRTAERIARNTVGVLDVKNRLDVRPDHGEGDQPLETRVLAALERDPYITGEALSVKARKGVVSLYGSVPTYFEKAHAEDLAARLGGVVALKNRLVVKGAPKPYASDPYVDAWRMSDYEWYRLPPMATTTGDAAIKREIERELYWSPFVEKGDVRVEVDKGVATLSGRVDSWSEYNAANENAYESGASEVVNHLVVE